MRIARITRTTCSCGFDGELAFFAAEGWRKACPRCGRLCVPHDQQAERTYGNRRFAGEEAVSVKFGFHPKEVKLAKRMMPKTGDCIRSDGSVEFPDSRTSKAFAAELAQTMDKMGIPKKNPL